MSAIALELKVLRIWLIIFEIYSTNHKLKCLNGLKVSSLQAKIMESIIEAICDPSQPVIFKRSLKLSLTCSNFGFLFILVLEISIYHVIFILSPDVINN